MIGKAWLVGAGPGDPELLTLKAARVLREADVILADDLASDEVLALANPAARIVHVGKRGGCASTSQAFIERLMVAEARAGRTVVRLKGGDPFIFGRGGEECDALRLAGIDVEVVNGITAGLAAATSVGVPLTHRDACHGVMFVTGHEREGTQVDWSALARTGLTLVIYMGVARAESIREGLLDGGLSAAMPALAVQNATRVDERRLATTLGSLVEDLREGHIGSPAILVIGEVCRNARADSVSRAIASAARAG
jgi:uroporphyrin-III C-methyltransferase